MTEGSEDEMDDLELDTDEMRVELPNITDEMHIEYKELEVSTRPTEQLWSSSVEIDNFNEPVGRTFLIEQTPCPVYIQPDIPDSVVEHIASQTNPYAKEALSPVQYSAWQDTTADEIGAFFGMNILTPRPRVKWVNLGRGGGGGGGGVLLHFFFNFLFLPL